MDRAKKLEAAYATLMSINRATEVLFTAEPQPQPQPQPAQAEEKKRCACKSTEIKESGGGNRLILLVKASSERWSKSIDHPSMFGSLRKPSSSLGGISATIQLFPRHQFLFPVLEPSSSALSGTFIALYFHNPFSLVEMTARATGGNYYFCCSIELGSDMSSEVDVSVPSA